MNIVSIAKQYFLQILIYEAYRLKHTLKISYLTSILTFFTTSSMQFKYTLKHIMHAYYACFDTINT